MVSIILSSGKILIFPITPVGEVTLASAAAERGPLIRIPISSKSFLILGRCVAVAKKFSLASISAFIDMTEPI